MGAAIKEAIQIQESHQIQPTKKQEENKIQALTKTRREEKADEPPAHWKQKMDLLREQIAAINTQTQSNNELSRNQRRTQNRGNS